MSVVTAVLLFFGLSEEWIEQAADDEYLPVNAINAWLQERRYGTLNGLDKYTRS